MRGMLFEAVVERIVLVVRGDEIPAGAATADLVERGELARQRIGFVEGGGGGGDEAEMFGDRGERRQDGHRLEFDHLAHSATRLGRPRQADGGRVGQE